MELAQGVEYVNAERDVDNKSPIISVCIQTYNHEPYIRDCIDSVLDQDIDEPYEILIGEDSSDDRTREICKEYADKYPEKIRLILRDRTDILYVAGAPTGRTNLLSNIQRARGEYLAFCEGDDFWISKDKLRVQLEKMREKQASISYHLATLNPKSTDHSNCIPNIPQSSMCHKTPFKNVLSKKGSLMPMASIMLKKDLLKDNLDGFMIAPGAHFYMQIVCSEPNGALFIPDIYSYYRRNSSTSFTANYLSKRGTRHLWIEQAIMSLNQLNEYYNYKYDSYFQEISKNKVIDVLKTGNILSNKYPDVLKLLNLDRLENLKMHFIFFWGAMKYRLKWVLTRVKIL